MDNSRETNINYKMGCTDSKSVNINENSNNSECPVKKFFNSKKDYYVEQFNTSCLSQYSYYIESNGEAAIIDPIRDIDLYLELLEKRNAKLKYVFETHFHADFVSGHLELSNKTEAEIVFGPSASTRFKIITASENQEFKLGEIIIKLIHTPGHTDESSCFLLIDKESKERVLFTGDTIFLGEVGRPDLAVKGNISEKDLASFLFESIQKIKKLPDDVIIFPGHGAGSACGKKISSGSGDTIKGQKEKNYAFDDNLTKEDFIELATSNIPNPPSYFFHDVSMNKQGCESVDKVLERSNKPIKTEDFLNILHSDEVKNGRTIILDTRDFQIANKGFIKGSVIIPLKITYAIWTATLFDYNIKFVLITDSGKEKESILRLARVGYENVIGYLEGGIESYMKLRKVDIVSVNIPNDDEIRALINENKINLLDVREKGELDSSGKIENAMSYPLSKLLDQIDELKNSQKPIGIYCKTGGRASVSGSLLVKNSIEASKIYILGGFDNLVGLGFKSDK
jgi:glyoxylase-like metal-dependent hydrolase (beta-lactamase superfamily II)/rhodanese-related sulfurtransferase